MKHVHILRLLARYGGILSPPRNDWSAPSLALSPLRFYFCLCLSPMRGVGSQWHNVVDQDYLFNLLRILLLPQENGSLSRTTRSTRFTPWRFPRPLNRPACWATTAFSPPPPVSRCRRCVWGRWTLARHGMLTFSMCMIDHWRPPRKDFMGECSKEQAFAILDAFYEMGGNFIDT